MFTFKKFAVVSVAALTAFTISCSDDKDDGDKLIIPSGYDNSKVVTLGGSSNKTDGSFLDADGSITVYLSGTAPKDKIDLVFDGKNLFVVSYYDTPAGASALGNDKLAGGESAFIWSYTAADESPTAIVDFISDRDDAEDYGSPNFAPSEGKKYAVFTTGGIFAIAKVNSVSESAIVLSVGNFDVAKK